ncbi:hypothetical protein [Desulfovibrio sp. TomC]|nr:hypothetical protein [Desulfovibrio sp. TomC]KHK03058.1 hypothetical protein NY78_1587 [Desulfovibrio sp. TomC]
MPPKARAVLEDQLATVSGWLLTVAQEDGHLRALFCRAAPQG